MDKSSHAWSKIKPKNWIALMWWIKTSLLSISTAKFSFNYVDASSGKQHTHMHTHTYTHIHTHIHTYTHAQRYIHTLVEEILCVPSKDSNTARYKPRVETEMEWNEIEYSRAWQFTSEHFQKAN